MVLVRYTPEKTTLRIDIVIKLRKVTAQLHHTPETGSRIHLAAAAARRQCKNTATDRTLQLIACIYVTAVHLLALRSRCHSPKARCRGEITVRIPRILPAQGYLRIRTTRHLLKLQLRQRTKPAPVRISHHITRIQKITRDSLTVAVLGIIIARLEIIGKDIRRIVHTDRSQLDAVTTDSTRPRSAENIHSFLQSPQGRTDRARTLLRRRQLVQKSHILFLADFVFHYKKSLIAVRILDGGLPRPRISVAGIKTEAVIQSRYTVVNQNRIIHIRQNIRC